MQIQLDHIRGRECLLRQGGEEEFIDDALTRDAHRTLFLAGWMGRYHHAAGHTLSPHKHFRAVVETAHHRDMDSMRLLRFAPPLELTLDREHCQRLAALIHWPLREEDFLLLEALFQPREQRPANSRRRLSERTYEFLSLLSGRLVQQQAVAARTALEWGIFRLLPRPISREQ